MSCWMAPRASRRSSSPAISTWSCRSYRATTRICRPTPGITRSPARALPSYSQFNLEQVLHLATEHKVVPAGITRFIIPGRVLRLHVPLDKLASDESLDSKNDWLDQLIQEKLVNRRLRYYQEPVILLDE